VPLHPIEREGGEPDCVSFAHPCLSPVPLLRALTILRFDSSSGAAFLKGPDCCTTPQQTYKGERWEEPAAKNSKPPGVQAATFPLLVCAVKLAAKYPKLPWGIPPGPCFKPMNSTEQLFGKSRRSSPLSVATARLPTYVTSRPMMALPVRLHVTGGGGRVGGYALVESGGGGTTLKKHRTSVSSSPSASSCQLSCVSWLSAPLFFRAGSASAIF